MASTSAKNTASLSQLGNLFQYLIALKVCLESKEGSIVNIEKHGDLTTEKHNYEIKHHNDPKYTLTKTHIDFWKSLSNWVDNREILSSHSSFILLTSAIVNKTSPFFEWNKSTHEEKLNIINDIKHEVNQSQIKYKTIRPYLDKVFEFSHHYTKDDLLKVLDKLTIKHSYENAESLYNELLNHPVLLFANKSKKPSLLRSLLGFIVEKGIHTPTDWDIEVSEFHEFIQEQARKLVNNEILDFPDLSVNCIVDDETYKKDFITKIKEIPYPEKVNEAAENYTHTQNVILLMGDRNPHVLNEFSKQVEEAGVQLRGMKEIICLEIENYDAKKLIKKSKILYNKASLDVKTGNNVPPNIQRGIIHTHADESDFYWKIKDEDLEG